MISVRKPAISWKALLLGSATIWLLGLVLQLAFLMVAVGQLMFVKRFPEAAGWAPIVLYLVGLLGLFLTMAAGGYVTARMAPDRLLLHASLVALLGGGLSFLQSLNVGGLTLTGLLLFLLGIPFTFVGCWLRVRQVARQARAG